MAVVVALSGTSGVISWPQNSGYLSPSHHALEGTTLWSPIFLLSTRSIGPRLALHHVAPHLAQAKRSHHHRASHAHQAQAQTLQRAQTACWPDHQAPCALCEREAAHPQPPPVPPEPDTPNPPASPHGGHLAALLSPYWLSLSWLAGAGQLAGQRPSQGGRWRQFQCTSCEGYFLETHGTPLSWQAGGGRADRPRAGLPGGGLGIRATARVFEVEANTVLNWLVEAAEQLRAFSAHFLCDLHVEQLQLDELYAVLRETSKPVRSARTRRWSA